MCKNDNNRGPIILNNVGVSQVTSLSAQLFIIYIDHTVNEYSPTTDAPGANLYKFGPRSNEIENKWPTFFT